MVPAYREEWFLIITVQIWIDSPEWHVDMFQSPASAVRSGSDGNIINGFVHGRSGWLWSLKVHFVLFHKLISFSIEAIMVEWLCSTMCIYYRAFCLNPGQGLIEPVDHRIRLCSKINLPSFKLFVSRIFVQATEIWRTQINIRQNLGMNAHLQ